MTFTQQNNPQERSGDGSFIKRAAESALLQLTSRLSGICLTGICAWLLKSVQEMQIAAAVVAMKVDALANQVSQLQETVFKIPH